MIELHDQLLGELHAAIPDSKYAGMPPARHTRVQQRRSLDAVPEDQTNEVPVCGYSSQATDPQAAAAAACVFANNVNKTIELSSPFLI